MIRRAFRHGIWSHQWFLFGLLTGWMLLLVLAARVQAQTPQAVTDDDINRIASQLYCPVCQNVTLDVCPTLACDNWRAAIRSKLEAGWSDQAIQDYFVAQFGARVIGTPPKTGLNWLLYAVAPVGALGLALAGFLVLRKKTGSQVETKDSTEVSLNGSEPWREQLARDIRKDDSI